MTEHRGAAAAEGRDLLDRRRGGRAGQPNAAAPRIYDANRYLLVEMLERLGAVVTDLGILADDPAELARALAKAAAWPRSGAHLGRRFHRRSRSRARRRRAHRQPGVLARRHQAGAAGGDGRDPRRSAQGPAAHSGAAFVGLAGQSGRGVRDLRAGGQAVAAAARRRAAASAGGAAGAASPSPTRRRRIAANTCGWRYGVPATARSRRSNTRRMAPAS